MTNIHQGAIWFSKPLGAKDPVGFPKVSHDPKEDKVHTPGIA